jgi:hypothetical protein
MSQKHTSPNKRPSYLPIPNIDTIVRTTPPEPGDTPHPVRGPAICMYKVCMYKVMTPMSGTTPPEPEGPPHVVRAPAICLSKTLNPMSGTTPPEPKDTPHLVRGPDICLYSAIALTPPLLDLCGGLTYRSSIGMRHPWFTSDDDTTTPVLQQSTAGP